MKVIRTTEGYMVEMPDGDYLCDMHDDNTWDTRAEAEEVIALAQGKHKTLLDAQLSAFPDSIVLTDMEMFEALLTTVPDWLVDHKIEDWDKFEAHYEMGVFTDWYYYEWKQKETERTRAQWARSAFLYKSQDPKGFFYACGKKPNGTYRYVGYRFGLNDHEYASGFIGMEYTPQQVNRS